MPYRGINGRKSGAVRQRQSANRDIHNGIERGDGTVTLSDAIEKMRKHRLLIGITDGEKSDRATALDMLLSIAKRELTKQESREDK